MTALEINGQTLTPSRTGNGVERSVRGTRDGVLYTARYEIALALEGRVFMAGDADANDRVTGQTSFADTAPTFLLRVPSGTTALLLGMYLGQAGTVGGGAIDVNMAISSASDPYASGGTAEAVFCARTDNPVGALCSLYSGPTITTALATKQVRSWALGQDVSPAEGAVQEVIWTPDKQGHPLALVGPCGLAVFTSAGTTGPTWYWSFSWAEIPTTSIN